MDSYCVCAAIGVDGDDVGVVFGAVHFGKCGCCRYDVWDQRGEFAWRGLFGDIFVTGVDGWVDFHSDLCLFLCDGGGMVRTTWVLADCTGMACWVVGCAVYRPRYL